MVTVSGEHQAVWLLDRLFDCIKLHVLGAAGAQAVLRQTPTLLRGLEHCATAGRALDNREAAETALAALRAILAAKDHLDWSTKAATPQA